VDDLADAPGGLAGIGLPGVEPGDDGFGREGGDQAGGPVQPGPGGYLRGQVAPGDLGGGGGQGVGLVAELGLGGGGSADDAVEFLRTGSIGRTMLAGADARTADHAIASVRAALTPYADAKGVHLAAAVWLVRAVAP
jgi:hypothetical protein